MELERIIKENTTGVGNTAIGKGALKANIKDMAAGHLALGAMTTSITFGNIAIGYQAYRCG